MIDLPSGTFNLSYAQDMQFVRTTSRKVLLILFVFLIYIFPTMFGSRYLLHLLIVFCIWIIASHGLNILTGLCGQISLGHAGFFGIGAYSTGILANSFNLPFWITIPAAGFISSLVGIIFGLPSVRIKGFYLALTSMAAHFIFLYLGLHWESLTGGAHGLTIPYAAFGNFSMDTPQKFYPFALTFCIIMTYVYISFARTSLGRAFIATKNNDVAAKAIGVNIFVTKAKAFAIGCFYAGIAGAVWGHYVGFTNIDHYPFVDSLWYVGILIVGGMGSVVGPIFGVLFIKGLSELMTLYVAPILGQWFPSLGMQISASISLIFFALAIMFFVVYEPRGLNYRWNIFKTYYRLWPFPY